jgi:hypothetical protein
MQDANALDRAETDALARRNTMQNASAATEEAKRRLERSVEDIGQVERRAERAEHNLSSMRRETAIHAAAAGMGTAHAENALVALDTPGLVGLAPRDFDGASAGLHALVTHRREQIALLRQRRDEMDRAERAHAEERRIRDDRQLDADKARERRAQSDAEVEAKGQTLVGDWDRHFAGLEQLKVSPDEGAAALTALADWVVTFAGDNPARGILHSAQQRAAERLAERGATLDSRTRVFNEEVCTLEDERSRLEAGVDPPPPIPYTRGPDVRKARDGAPLWHLVDFRDAVTVAERAGLEAAGLLDAWVSPDGCLQAGDGGALLHDTQVLARPPLTSSLADWLLPAVPRDSTVAASVVAKVLSGIACGHNDATDAEAWVSPDGRFRLGALAGAWAKPAAVHIGHTARAAARAQRLAEIADRLARGLPRNSEPCRPRPSRSRATASRPMKSGVARPSTMRCASRIWPPQRRRAKCRSLRRDWRRRRIGVAQRRV